MTAYLVIFLEVVGVVSLVQILATSPVLQQRRPVKFTNPAQEGSRALTLVIFLILLTAILQRLFPGLFVGIISFLPFTAQMRIPRPAPISASGLWVQIGVTAVMLTPVLISLFHRKQPWLSVGLKKQMTKGGLISGAALVMLLIFLRGLVYHLINGPYTNDILWLLLASLVTAFGEEFIFRGYLQIRLMDWWGDTWGWVGTAALYALWSVLPLLPSSGPVILITLAYRLGLGLLLGWIARSSGGILAGWLYHAFHTWFFWI